MKAILTLLILFLTISLYGQTGKPIRGIVIDNASGQPLPATVVVLNTNPQKGVMCDVEGNFFIESLPIGRYDIQASILGYEPAVFKEVAVSAGKEAFITIVLKESLTELDEIVVRPKVNKEEPMNNMATTSARMLSVEEASRYAGGMDDPARLVSSFAGVAGNVSSNGISVRGNSPEALQWRLEGVEIPNPTHFSDITGAGGGVITALSSQVLGNSDFFTGAFPSEYSNALSGVFDMQLRDGNRWEHQHAIQVGTLGMDISSEGPLKKGGQASYLFNYRYATMALVSDIAPDLLGDDAGGMRYQDLSFKLNFPSRKIGTFSIWGIGLVDHYRMKPEKDKSKWETVDDNSDSNFKQSMGAGGIGHKYFFNDNTYIKSALAASYNKNTLLWDIYDTDMQPSNGADLKGTNWSTSFNTYVNKKFSSRHTNRTGINVSRLAYDVNHNISPDFPNAFKPMANFAKSDGNTMLYSAFTNSTIRLGRKITANIGLSGLYFALNKDYSIEPRAGIKWQISPKHSMGLAYGRHSKHEKLDYYFVERDNQFVNKKLNLAKADHYVLSYDWSLSDNLHLKIEAYYQYLSRVPVAKDSTFSIINQKDWYLNTALVNDGKGKNYGIDITLERYLADGYYYMFTGSVFNSRYKTGDGVWRNTRLNRTYLFNVLGGREWRVGRKRQNTLNLNLKLSYQGGERYSPIDQEASILAQDAIYDASKAYSKQLDPALVGSFTFSYKINRKKLAHEFAVKIINITGYKEFNGHVYNYKENLVEMDKSSVVMPNISYKIEF